MMQRMKLHLVVDSSSVRDFIDLTKLMDTVGDVTFFAPPLFGPASAAPPATSPSSALSATLKSFWMSLTLPSLKTCGIDSGSGSLFFSSQPPTVYCTAPAKCKILKLSRASLRCTSGKKALALWSLARSRTNLSSDG